MLLVITVVLNLLQLAREARERKKKFSSSVEVLRFERTLELTRRQLRKTDNIARNDARLQSTMMLMFHEAENSPRSTLGHKVEGREPAVTSGNLGVTSDSLPQSSECHISQELAEKYVTHDGRDSGCVMSSVVTTTTSVTSITMPSSVVMTSVAKVTASVAKITSSLTTSSAKTTTSFTAMSLASLTTTSLAVSEVVAGSCVSLPLNTNSAAVSVVNANETKLTSSRFTAKQSSLHHSTVVVTSPTTAVVLTSSQSSHPFTITTNKFTSSVARSADVKSIDSVAGKSADSADPIAVTTGKSVGSAALLADAATVKSFDSVASASAKSLEAYTVALSKSTDAITRAANEVTTISPASTAAASFKALPISSPVPLSNIKSLSTPQSPSPSPKGHVTFSDQVTEIQPSVSSAGGVNGKPRRMPPAPPPRKAIKNVTTNVCPTSPSKPRDRPCSAVEPLASTGVDDRPAFHNVNGIGRVRPLSMAPLATVDSDSDSSVGTDSKTGTIRRNTAQSADKRNLDVDQRNGARGRTPPPVPTRKTSSLTSSLTSGTTKNSDGFLMQDVQYSNLHDVRQECAKLKLASSQEDGRPNGTKTDGIVKCEETEIY